MKKYLLILGFVLLGCNESNNCYEMIPGAYTSIGRFTCEETLNNNYKNSWLRICKDTETGCEYLSNRFNQTGFILIQGTCKL